MGKWKNKQERENGSSLKPDTKEEEEVSRLDLAEEFVEPNDSAHALADKTASVKSDKVDEIKEAEPEKLARDGAGIDLIPGENSSDFADFERDSEDVTESPEVTEELLRKIPKVELHCHLDGSLRPATILELSERQRVRLPASDLDGLRKILVVGDDCRSLEDYLKAFDITLSVMQDEESLERIAYELVADAAAENIRYIEVRYSPILHTRRGLRLTRIVDAVNDGLKRGEQEFGVITGVIICGMRNINPEISYQLAELAVAYKNRGVVAFDLAGAEPRPFRSPR